MPICAWLDEEIDTRAEKEREKAKEFEERKWDIKTSDIFTFAIFWKTPLKAIFVTSHWICIKRHILKIKNKKQVHLKISKQWWLLQKGVK